MNITKDNTKINDDIKKIVSEVVNVKVSDLSDDLLVREELGVDSITAMEIIVRLEKEYEIEIDEENLINIKTVKDFIDYIKEEIK